MKFIILQHLLRITIPIHTAITTKPYFLQKQQQKHCCIIHRGCDYIYYSWKKTITCIQSNKIHVTFVVTHSQKDRGWLCEIMTTTTSKMGWYNGKDSIFYQWFSGKSQFENKSPSSKVSSSSNCSASDIVVFSEVLWCSSCLWRGLALPTWPWLIVLWCSSALLRSAKKLCELYDHWYSIRKQTSTIFVWSFCPLPPNLNYLCFSYQSIFSLLAHSLFSFHLTHYTVEPQLSLFQLPLNS